MDYFNMRNVQADTEMRNAISGTSSTSNVGRNDRPAGQTPS